MKCSLCGMSWTNRSDFLTDPDVVLIGYQPSFVDCEDGALLFNHSCGTSFSVQADQFTDLFEGPMFSEHAPQSEQCPGLCLNEFNLDTCPVKCECAYVREVLQKVKRWPKEMLCALKTA